MTELVYPIGDVAPMIPPMGARNVLQMPSPDVEIFPIIREDGLVIGRATRDYCHNGSRLLHPVVHLHIIDREANIYLQKRSMTKDLLPGRWDTAVGGHIKYGESVVEALLRECSEELNLREFNPVHICSYRYDTRRDAEFVFVFAAVGHFNLVPDRNEVDEGLWWTIPQIEKAAGGRRLTPNFVKEFNMIKDKLLALL